MEGSRQQTNRLEGAVPTAPSFVAAAHELKSPLALVRQLALHLESGEASPSELQEIAHRITLTSERALRLTTDITKSSRLEDSLFSLEPLNPVVLCQEVVDEMKPLYAAHGRTIVMTSRARSLLALANRDLLRRILLNFADNALHYSGEGPVTITASLRDGGSCIRLGVRDYGPALPSTMRKNVGQKSAHVHSRPESSGLGIYIARQFADVMHATIGATSHRDGATFYVDIGTSSQLRLL